MKKQLLLFLTILPALLFAQQQVTFPEDFQTDALNGKEVTIANTLTLTNNYYVFQNSGSVTLSNGYLWTPTEKNLPGNEMFIQKNEENAKNQLILAKGDYNYMDDDGTCRIGQTITGLTGKAIYSSSSGKYTIIPTKQPVFTGNKRPTSLENQSEYNIKVASFNIENYNNYGEVQRTKVSVALKALDADIYALVEVIGNAALQDLCDQLNTTFSTNRYVCIKNTNSKTQMCAFIYNSEKIKPYKDLQFNTHAIWNNKVYLKERKVAQAFELKSNNERFIICLNHWKAKDTDEGDGQGGAVAQRKIQAEATLTFINEITNYFEDPDVLVVGDLNSYSKEDPIRILEKGGLVNMLQKYSPNNYSYAYNSNGSYTIGYLDHSLATSSLDAQICYAQPFHINADEPSALKINNGIPQKDNMYRCSDHNPIVTFINLEKGTTDIKNIPVSRPLIRIIGDPRNGFLTLVSSTDLSINCVEFVNINGQVVASYNSSDTGSHFSLPVRNLPSGFYLIRVYDTQNGCTTCKIVLP